MFDLDAGEELDLLVETARSFATEALEPGLRKAENERQVASEARAAFTQIGLAGLELPEALGGAGLGALARVLVNEELGAADAGAALALDPFGPAFAVLAELGGESALRTYASPLAEVDGARVLLVTRSEAQLASGGDTLSGYVPWVPADRVDLLVVLDADGACLARDGIVLEPLRGSALRAAGGSALRIDGARIVERWRDPSGASRALARARLYVASLLLGVLRQASEFSRKYALQRQAFGRPIAHHQALAFLITDMRIAVDSARLLVHEAAWRMERVGGAEALAAAAFVEVVEAACFIGPNGVQILGGHGFMQDYPVEKYMREARALGLMLGGIDAAREEAGRALAASESPVELSFVEAS